MSNLKYSKNKREHRNTRNKYTLELFFEFFDMTEGSKQEKEAFKEIIVDLV
jgi:hypothetical protein